jgi:DNA uptake protein ComE-like DNA-binding protein
MIRSFLSTALGAAFALVTIVGCDTGSRESADTAAPAAAGPDTGAASGAASEAGGMLDPNSASREQLAAVPGLGAALADSLVARRPFDTMLAVDSVLARQLSEAQRDSVYARLWKPLDLNSASAAEIELIPRVGARMRHEFEEYRPYRTIEQFRREMGKYVDDAEVARLERYVTIR